MATTPTKGPADTILLVGIELGAVGVFTLIGGASDEAGSVVILFMIGLWMIYLVSDGAVLASISRGVGNIASQATS
jgi:hypothetical protein